MKTLTFLFIPAFAVATAIAEPVQIRNISADAKWVVHLDVEKLLTSRFGEFVGGELIDKKLARPIRKMREDLGIDLNWREIQSLTAYGSAFKKGADRSAVLLIRSKHDVSASLDSVIEKLARHATDGTSTLQKTQEAGGMIYALNGEVFGSAVGAEMFVLSKSKEQLAHARRVLSAKSPNMSSSKSFPALRDPGQGFLVAAVSEPFSGGIKLPAQAEGLKNAESGRIVAGERDERVFVNLAINTREAEAAVRIQQVVQGLIALATLSQTENPDLQKLALGTKVSSADKTVTIEVDVPTADVIAKVAGKQSVQRK